MKKYAVISHQINSNAHLNVQDLLPASCRLITGVFVTAQAKEMVAKKQNIESLSFPQRLIMDLLDSEQIEGLFYSYLKTRSMEQEAVSFFNREMLPVFMEVFRDEIVFDCWSEQELLSYKERITILFETKFTTYLFEELHLFEKSNEFTTAAFTDFIKQAVLEFLYKHRYHLFFKEVQEYQQPVPYECGNISLLVNGNSFLLRDYTVTANRKIKTLQKEVVPFYEPLEVNSSLQLIFKNTHPQKDRTLFLKTYIEYEYE